MAEPRVVANAERSPTGCVACGTHRGPFLDFDLTIFSMATATGQVDVDGSLYLCIGDRERPGCLVQWAEKSGILIHADKLDEVLVYVAKLEAENEELRTLGKKKSLTLDDARLLLEPSPVL